MIWKLPLLQLIVLFPRPPFGLFIDTFAIVHMFGDPIDTLGSLMHKFHKCQYQAVHWLSICKSSVPESQWQWSDPFEVDLWKCCALIVDTYDEFGMQIGDRVNDWLTRELKLVFETLSRKTD